MNIIGTVVDIQFDVEIPKTAGGSYKGARLTYRDDKGALKEQAFHNNALKFNPQIKEALNTLKVQDEFTLVKEKEGEFWNVKNIFVGKGTATASTTAATPSPKSTYETAEERAKKQVFIIRQSSLASAASLAAPLKLKDKGEVLSLAEEFVAFVMQTEYDDGSIYTLKSDIIE